MLARIVHLLFILVISGLLLYLVSIYMHWY